MTVRRDLTDAASFAAWVTPHIPKMGLLAGRLTFAAEAEDVVQDALARAWLKRHQFDPDRGTPAAWLLAIVADQARKASRRSQRATHRLQADQVSDADVDQAFDIEAAVRRLTERQQLAIDCYYFAGLSVAETSAVMRCSEGSVKSTLFDAREKLRRLLEVR